jgi:hypothetical protein
MLDKVVEPLFPLTEHVVISFFFPSFNITQLVRAAGLKLVVIYLKKGFPLPGKKPIIFSKNGDLSIFLKGFSVLKFQNVGTGLVFSN